MLIYLNKIIKYFIQLASTRTEVVSILHVSTNSAPGFLLSMGRGGGGGGAATYQPLSNTKSCMDNSWPADSVDSFHSTVLLLE